MMGVTSYDVIFNEVYIKSQLNIILLSRPLGDTHHCSTLHDYIYKIPANYCIMTRPLGATLIEVFISNCKSQVATSMTARHLGAIYMEYSVYMIEMNKPDFFKVETLIGASLKLSLCSPLKTWGATGIMHIKEEHLHFISFEQIRKINYMTRCRQQL